MGRTKSRQITKRFSQQAILEAKVCLRYGGPNAVSNAIDYAKFRSRSHDAVIRVYDDASNVIETHEQACENRSLRHYSLLIMANNDCLPRVAGVRLRVIR